MYTSLALMLGTAAAAMAAPTEARNSPLLFRLSMEIDDSLVSLTAVKNGTDGEIFLKAGRPSVYPGFDGMSTTSSSQTYCSKTKNADFS